MKISSKLRWARHSDDYDLDLTNADELTDEDWENLGRLLEKVKSATGRGKHLDRRAVAILTEWINTRGKLLREKGYSLPSNWFMDELVAEEPLALACRSLWDTMFAARPESRLTDWRKRYGIIPEAFELWWCELESVHATKRR